MRINLNVPYTDKEEAKSIGCRWDAVNHTWFVMAREDITGLTKWFKTDNDKQSIDYIETDDVPTHWD